MIHNLVRRVAMFSAILGGVLLSALVVLTTLSIAGRSLSKLAHGDWGQAWLGPVADWIIAAGFDEIKGTYELTEAGVALAIFAFLPLCQFHGAHATVDIFTSGLRPRASRILTAFWEVILTAIIIFVSLRLYEGMFRYINNGETTLFLQFPVWWAYLPSVVAAFVACLTGLYCVYARILEAARNQMILPES